MSVETALETVFDPEYPGVSIVELGLVESVDVSPCGVVAIGLVPTFSGCPALDFIARDVNAAVSAVPGVVSCNVSWLRSPVWSPARVSPEAVGFLEREFTVTLRRADGSLRCPVCGNDTDISDTAAVGPARCRSLAWCASCRNPVEVLK